MLNNIFNDPPMPIERTMININKPTELSLSELIMYIQLGIASQYMIHWKNINIELKYANHTNAELTGATITYK